MHIGDFARLAGATVRALRHYQGQGLLLPAEIDPLTGYRAYRYEQLAALDRILALRDPGFSLAETRALLAGGPDAIEACLLQHRHRLAPQVAPPPAPLRRVPAPPRAVAA